MNNLTKEQKDELATRIYARWEEAVEDAMDNRPHYPFDQTSSLPSQVVVSGHDRRWIEQLEAPKP